MNISNKDELNDEDINNYGIPKVLKIFKDYESCENYMELLKKEGWTNIKCDRKIDGENTIYIITGQKEDMYMDANVDIEYENNEKLNKNNKHLEIKIKELEEKLYKSSIKAQNLFENLQKLQNDIKYSYIGISKEELDYVINNLSNIRNKYKMKTQELSKLFIIISKYISNIKNTETKKTVYKSNIENIMNILKKKTNIIKNYEIKDKRKVGHLYNYQLDYISNLKGQINKDIGEIKKCKEMKRIREIIEEYYRVICIRIDYYTKQLHQLNTNSPDYTEIFNKLSEYRLLYQKLLLYIKHYKIIYKEQIMSCQNVEGNLTHIYEFLERIELCIEYRTNKIYEFIINSK